MELDQIAEFDQLIDIVSYTSQSMVELYENIDNYDRKEAAALIAHKAGLLSGVVLRLTQLRG